MPSLDLFDDAPSQASRKKDKGKGKAKPDNFTINPTFAAKYEEKKRGEELSKLKDRYGSDYEESEDSEDFSSEDSDAEFVTPAVDAAILRTLNKIKRGDPSIYGKTKVFQEEEQRHGHAPAAKASTSKSKPVLLRDFQRKALMATLGQGDGDVNPEAEPTPAQEDAALKAETRRAFLGDDHDDSESDEDGHGEDLLVPREKTKGEMEADEEEYARFLRSAVGRADIDEAFRRSAAEADNNDEDEFLRKYILGRGWLDKEAKKIPKYADVVGEAEEPSRPSGANSIALDEALDDEDFEHEDKADAFESKYNFRFEDQAGADLVTHSRDAVISVRRKDDSRKQARESVKSRKAEEKRAKMDELERMKALKRQEVLDKLARVRKNAGDEGFDVEGFDFDSDFDPEAHDRRMEQAFDKAYYGREDADGKPVWDDDINIDDIFTHDDDPLDMDADFEPGGEAYDPSAPSNKASKRQKQREKKKDKKRKATDAGLENQASRDDGNLSPGEQRKRLSEAVDEYRKMEYEDIIGDLPTRFKYTQVEPDSFDLTATEILMATDSELNEVVGLRKIAPYRTPDGSKKAGAKKKKLKEFRALLADRKWGQDRDEGSERPLKRAKVAQASGSGAGAGDDAGLTKKRKGKKERQRAKQEGGPAS